ncbi:hypothetical protein F5884DRAFT_677068 [Xylogone sp. PMI_703]|nr:hypothetical protein F5884DRAFT_677068 [Xylogone sp. PMI_703]
MAQLKFDASLLQNGTGKEIVSYLNELRRHNSDLDIGQALCEAVNRGYLPPKIFTIFLSWSSTPETIAFCIRHGPSRSIRRQGIKRISKTLARPKKWEPMWRAMGGVEGLIDLFAAISVAEVKLLARAIGGCNHGPKVAAREEAVEGLLHALLPSHYPGSEPQNYDSRPIQDHYAWIVPASSAEFVAGLLDARDLSNPLYRRLPTTRLVRTHGKLLRMHSLEILAGKRDKDDFLYGNIRAFAYNLPPEPSQDPKISASMAFAAEALQLRLNDIANDSCWPYQIESDILFSLLDRYQRRHLPEGKLHDVIMLGLKLLEAKPALESSFRSGRIWDKLLARWEKEPELYDDALAFALRLGLGGSQKLIGQSFLQVIVMGHVKPERRWSLLRLYCLNVPKNGFDLDLVSDLKPLAKQMWSSDVFYRLGTDEAIKLLKGLHKANPEYSFLQPPGGVSILSNKGAATPYINFNADLLLTMFQRDSPDVQSKVKHVVDELRQKASTTRDQADRAHIAKATSAYAIASGNLELYCEIITWQRRFIRDPLTAKVVFGHAAVMTNEGIDLLSGIQLPSRGFVPLAKITASVLKANEILKLFHESRSIAKREPSFSQPHWAGVTSLLGAVIDFRIGRAGVLQENLQVPEPEFFTAIWGNTFVMLSDVDADVLNQAYAAIERLLDTLPPPALAAASKALLESQDKNTKNPDRQSENDILERLSYAALQRLADSNKPELAQKLVLRTIVDRPDASSWHRQLFSRAFLKNLPAKNAHQLLLDFATAIGEKLEEQSYVKIDEVQTTSSTLPPPLVKVTTVKYLAQLLDNAEFISADAAIEVLLELFKVGTHRDIRLATLESLLSVLNRLCSGPDENWRSNTLIDKIMEALKTIIPVAGSINESSPLRQEDWEEAMKAGRVPRVSDTLGGPPPLLSTLLKAPDAHRYPGLKKLKAEFTAQLLLPLIRQSQEEHQQWITLFLTKHKATFTAEDLPPTPITSKIWDTLIGSYQNLIPESILKDFNRYVVMTIAPPTALKEFNTSLRKNTDIRNTAQVQHWLSIYGHHMNSYHSSEIQLLTRCIRRGGPVSVVSDGITFDKVLDVLIGHASLFLADYETYADIWDEFVNDLRPPTNVAHDANYMESGRNLKWQKTGRLILERVITLVSNTKKRDIEEQKRRVLPTTTKLKFWLLPYPVFPNNEESDSQCKAFAEQLEEMLDSALSSDHEVLHWHKIAEDAATISTLFNTPEEQLQIAFYISDLTNPSNRARDQKSSALKFIQITLAMKLIEEGQEGLKKTSKESTLVEDLKQRLKRRIEEWQSDLDEGIRERVLNWRRQQKEIWGILIRGEERNK